MTDCLCVKGFNEITYDELMDVVGGFSWSDLGGVALAGGLTGGMAGLAGLAPGVIAGAVSGALISGAGYCFNEIYKGFTNGSSSH